MTPTDPPPPRRKWNIARWLVVFALVAMAWSGWRVYAFRSALAEAKALGWSVDYTDPVETIRKNWKAAFWEETWLDGVPDVSIPTGESFEQHLAIVHRLNPKTLVIDQAPTLRDLSALKPLSRIQLLSLYRCTGLTNVNALTNLSDLQELTLHGCTDLTNVDALTNLSALQRVTLHSCTGLTNLDGLKKLSSLQILRLNGCTGLTSVDALKNLSALQEVSLSDCTGLTNVDPLKNLSALQMIKLYGCTGLTKESVAALKAALPKANIFSYDK